MAKRGGKPTDQHIIDMRMEYVENFLSRGMRLAEIIATIEKIDADPKSPVKFNLSKRQYQNYIKKARENISKEARPKRRYYYERSIRRYDDLYNKLIKLNDFRSAALINEKLDKLLGLYGED
jgi:aminoglycoside phosphotransferase (APT) family kinase protein